MVKGAQKGKGASKRKPVVTNRNKTATAGSRHAGKCTVCKSTLRQEIEAAYLTFIPLPKIGETFGLSQQAILRHAQYVGLDEQRVSDTERVLKSIVARGFSQIKKIEGKLFIEALKELNKITGKHQAARENDADRERKRRQYERAVGQFIEAKKGEGVECDRGQAIATLAQVEPEINEYVN